MPRYFVDAYNNSSKSAKLLARALGGKLLKKVNSKYRPKDGDVVAKWGQGGLDKATQLYKMIDVPTVEWTDDVDMTWEWIDAGFPVYCRMKLRGHSGDGIVIAKTKEELPLANLYTKGVVGREYRVHVYDGKVVCVQQKKRRNGGNANAAIKNHQTGWVYVVDAITPYPDNMEQIAIDAVNCLGYNHGAVDIIVPKINGKRTPLVLEVNSAPGLTENGTVLKAYVAAIKGVDNENQNRD